jgi:hypothetical protein
VSNTVAFASIHFGFGWKSNDKYQRRLYRKKKLLNTRSCVSAIHSLSSQTASVRGISSSGMLRCVALVSNDVSQTLVLTRATRRNIPEDDSLHSHRRDNLKSMSLRDIRIP